MAKVIEFYVPKNFQPQLKWAPQFHNGKIIEFHSEAQESGQPQDSDWIGRPCASLL